jgi:tetratricopeptide (TPR) repeat protein
MVSKMWLAALSCAAATTILAAPPQAQNPYQPSQGAPVAKTFRGDSRADTPPPHPAPPVTAEMRGDIFMARKMYREAVDAYEEGPRDSAVLLNKTGIAYHQMLQFEAARKYYELAIRRKPDYAEAINNLGTIYYAHKSYRRAVNQYKKALRYSPESASIYSNLGTGYFARKEYAKAAEAWQHALALDPEVFEQRGSRGVLLQERSVEDRAKFHYYMAKTYAKAGATDRAIEYIRKALEEGFKERNKFLSDPEFSGLQGLPEFKELMASEQRVL